MGDLPTIALATILKNEGNTIERVVGSCKNEVNQVVLGVDRKSEDNTLELSKKLADVSYEFDFTTEEHPEGDFSAARNTIFKHVTTDWFIQLDGHELLINESGKSLREWCALADERGADSITILLLSPAMSGGRNTVHTPRIYKVSDRRYHSPIHNQFDTSETILVPGLIINHRHDLQSTSGRTVRQQQKEVMLPTLLKQRVADGVHDAYYFLMDFYNTRGDYEKSIKLGDEFFEKHGDVENLSRVTQWQVSYFMAEAYHILKEYDKALEWCDKSDVIEEKREVWLIRALVYEARGEIDKAHKVYEDMLNIEFVAMMAIGDTELYDYKIYLIKAQFEARYYTLEKAITTLIEGTKKFPKQYILWNEIRAIAPNLVEFGGPRTNRMIYETYIEPMQGIVLDKSGKNILILGKNPQVLESTMSKLLDFKYKISYDTMYDSTLYTNQALVILFGCTKATIMASKSRAPQLTICILTEEDVISKKPYMFNREGIDCFVIPKSCNMSLEYLDWNDETPVLVADFNEDLAVLINSVLAKVSPKYIKKSDLSVLTSEDTEADKPNVGFLSVWFERGQSYVTKTFIDVVKNDVNVFLLARATKMMGCHVLNTEKEWLLPNMAITSKYDVPAPVVTKWAVDNKLDIVVCNEEYNWDIISQLKDAGIKVVSFTDFADAKWDKLWKLYDLIFVGSQEFYNYLKDKGKVCMIPWGVDLSQFKSLEYENKTDFVHTAGWGGIDYRKGTPEVVRAFTQLSDDLTLTICSQLALKHYPMDVQDLIEYDNRITFREGTINNPAELYKFGKIAVQPSKQEGLGLSFPEAMACGLPVVTTDALPMSQFITEGVTGCLVPVTSITQREDGYMFPINHISVDDLGKAMLRAYGMYDKLYQNVIKHRENLSMGNFDVFKDNILKLYSDIKDTDKLNEDSVLLPK